ncbi:MAG: type IV secretion protein Rhs, partial [Opitutaceae bacterium]|nr:type IV secretion protein Rhs [Opitutaceae bacterium]
MGLYTRTLSYHATGQLEDEVYTAGLLDNHSVERSFDGTHRLSAISVPTIYTAGYSYDGASRLDTVTSGANTATYAYVTNSSLVDSVTFKQSSTTRLTTTKVHDKLNRITSITNTPSASSAQSVAYTYNNANQRTKATREDSRYWDYGYDTLGQVTSAVKKASGGGAIAGLTYGYTYDDLGNRKTATVNAQVSAYTATLLNQYSQRTVPGVIDVFGEAQADATVTVKYPAVSGEIFATTREGAYFHKQLTVDNSSADQNPAVKITGVKNLVGAGGEDAVTEITRSAFVPETPEVFSYDADGNLLADARWTYTWDAENRLVAM